MEKYNEADGVWRTIGGRRVFIKKGQSLSEAMIESGKFKNDARTAYRKAKEDLENFKKKKEEKESTKENDESKKKTIHTQSGDYTADELKQRDEEIKQMYKDSWEGKMSAKDLHDKLEEMKKDGKVSQGELSALQYDASNETRASEDKPYKLDQSKMADVYKSYREKRDKLEGIEKDELGNRNYDTRKDAKWTGKEYTNDEFMANLEDENWHTERKMLLDANLTDKQMEFVKNNTEFHNGSPSLDREITEELIKGAKGEKYKTPNDILGERKNKEISELESELKDISKNGKYDEKGNYREGVKQDYKSYSDKKNRYKELTGKDFDDSDVKIAYDPNKTYKLPNGKDINQDLMKEWYSGESPQKVKSDIEFEKSVLYDASPERREMKNAQIKEMEKYLNGMEKYESRISDDFGTKDRETGYPFSKGTAWEGTKSNSGLHGKDKIKAIDDEIKKAYPELKTSRTTHQGGYTDSFSYNVMEGDKPLIRSIDDFSDAEIERLYNKGYNRSWYKTKDDFKQNLKRDLEKGTLDVNQYGIDEDYRLTPYGKQVFKDIMKVSDAYNYDESDSMTDYFNTGHYINLHVGKDGKPYQVRESKSTSGNQITNSLQMKAYEKYKKEHPGSTITYDQFRNKK